MKKTNEIKTIRIVCGGSFIKLYDIDDERRDKIHKYFRFVDDKKKNSPAYRNKPYMDFHFYALDRRSNTIGIGFLDYLIAFIEQNGWEYELDDLREYEKEFDEEEFNKIDWKKEFNVNVRDYQIEAVKTALIERSGLIQAPTGAGKSLIMCMLVRLLDTPTLILFDKVGLVHQTHKEFLKFGFSPKDLGVVQGPNNLPKKITFATIQSKDKLYDFIELFKCVVVDECHSIRADGYQELLTVFKGSLRYGLSATPLSAENPAEKAKVIRYVGRIIYQEQNTNTLVEQGILAKPKIYFIRCDRGDDQTVVWENSGRDYANLYKQEIVENEYRNALIAKICSIKKNKKIIVLHEIIEHGETLLKTFEKLLPNRKIHLLSGKDNVKIRSDIIDIFEKSGNDIIIASKIFNVGVNVVTVDVVINTSASKGEISALQKLGRGLRTTKDKDTMEYWDILDENSRVFQRQAKRRINIYKKEGHVVETIEPEQLK